jgi:CheY-like chemotaxis protein
MTILIVDDDAVLCQFLTELLRDAGYAVVTAANGLEALKELRQANPQPCLILLDVMMPVMDGWTFREQQLQDPQLAAIPVVYISAIAHHRVQAAVTGAHHLLKPFVIQDLLQMVARFCAPN